MGPTQNSLNLDLESVNDPGYLGRAEVVQALMEHFVQEDVLGASNAGIPAHTHSWITEVLCELGFWPVYIPPHFAKISPQALNDGM